VLKALPDDPGARQAALTRLSTKDARSTLPADQFYRLVGDLHRSAQAQTVDDRVLPVVPATGRRPSGYDVDAARFRSLLSGSLASVRRPVNVVVQSDGESAKAAAAVGSRLAAARLSYVAATRADANGPQPAKPTATTTITTGEGPADLDRAREIAAALQLPASVIHTVPVRDVTYDVLVKLGSDVDQLLKLTRRS
jgi:hypothetical protein